MDHLPKKDRRLKIEAKHDSNNLKVWVADNGTGIKAEKIDQIFEPMESWKPDGTGMGLAISYSIIEMCGGNMWAENRPEGGALVGFDLPVPKGDKKR